MLQKRSYGSVEIISIDEEAFDAALRAGVEACVAAHPEVERVVLFGSFARGDWAPESDIDLLVVVSETHLPTLERAEVYRPFFASIPMDVNPIVVTSSEAARAGDDRGSVVHAALADGRVLFDRTG